MAGRLGTQHSDGLRHSLLHSPCCKFKHSLVLLLLTSLAQQTDDGSQYFILLILTDGIICDMPQTKAAVVNVSGSLCFSLFFKGMVNTNSRSDQTNRWLSAQEMLHSSEASS